jgi:hypothetical protein
MADLDLRRKQGFWETPRNIAVLIGATAAIAGVLGYKIGREPPAAPQPIVITVQPPAMPQPPQK